MDFRQRVKAFDFIRSN